MDKKERIAARAARFHQGDLVNLGIGMPTLVADHLPEGVEVLLQSENGFIGLGPAPADGQGEKEIDALSGATSSYGSFQKLEAAVLEQAKKGDSSIALVDTGTEE